ncbi:MAG: response regulator [Treponema sp.]|jgi:two-component system response regulator YesN|nr:response regulator [Treponema sp.]
MKRILIVDDEYLVRLGLKTIIDWPEYGYVVAGEASNGKEALELFDSAGADVILTDIKMPVMDGLELTRAVKEKNKSVTIIILSHYDEFSYAQEAINLGAFRYILKSELTKTNLLNMLKSIFYSENEEAADSPAIDGTKDITAQQERYIETYLFPFFSDVNTRVWGGVHPPFPEEEAGQKKKYLILCTVCHLTTLLHETRKVFPKTVKVLFTESFGDLASFAGYHHEKFKLVAILPFAENDLPSKNKLVESCTRIVRNVYQYYNVHLFIGLSSIGSANDMARLFAEAVRSVDLCFFSEKSFVCVHEQEESQPSGGPPRISYEKLSSFIEKNQEDAMLEYIKKIFKRLRELKNYTVVHNAFIDFLSSGKAVCEKYHLNDQSALSESKFEYRAFYDLLFIDDVELYINNLFLELLSGKQSGGITYSFIVKRSIDFIQQNYAKNISLSDAAENAEVSHSYLSFIFKQETGINFNTWLSRYRIEEAKKLLQETNMRIYEIAEKVGFANPYYFSKVFKEFTGVHCKEFRNTILPESR